MQLVTGVLYEGLKALPDAEAERFVKNLMAFTGAYLRAAERSPDDPPRPVARL